MLRLNVEGKQDVERAFRSSWSVTVRKRGACAITTSCACSNGGRPSPCTPRKRGGVLWPGRSSRHPDRPARRRRGAIISNELIWRTSRPRPGWPLSRAKKSSWPSGRHCRTSSSSPSNTEPRPSRVPCLTPPRGKPEKSLFRNSRLIASPQLTFPSGIIVEILAHILL